MFKASKKELRSVDELIIALEHIEEGELQSDIPANVRAELKRMKRNISSVLSFVSHSWHAEGAVDPELRRKMNEVRRECLLLNGIISKALLVQALRVGPAKLGTYTSRAMAKYFELMWAAHGMCLLTAPRQADELLAAL
ncbi:MAG: hypothetical protein ABSD20_13180 [Terriglobales bacterium]